MLIRRERPADVPSIREVHAAAFVAPADGQVPVEVGLVDALRASTAWIPALSLVAEGADAAVVGHVVCSRARLADRPVLALGPIGVLPDQQRAGVGAALMHAVLAAADALDEPLVVLLGHTGYYPRFGFRPASELGIRPPQPEWRAHFQARPLTAYDPGLRGEFGGASLLVGRDSARLIRSIWAHEQGRRPGGAGEPPLTRPPPGPTTRPCR